MAWIPMEFWRQIETAPKDGSEVFVYRCIDPWNVYGIAHWEECHGIAGWISRAIFDPPGVLGLGAPTHWRPMFTPPDSVQQVPRPDDAITKPGNQIEDLNRLNLELYRACRSAHALLDSKSRNAAQIERILRLAMGKAEQHQDARKELTA